MNMKFEMLMELVLVAPDPPAAPGVDVNAVADPDPDEPEPPLLHAARSSAPTRTMTSAPPLNRRVGSRIA
jgi:hypothetical protein